mmetsp:Transcript_22164/g.58991  ORF Transcript_22164/g.58991 Transcript_22164/m.58991 type:complete len:83 (-) Transcript_22164:776-1024(-)
MVGALVVVFRASRKVLQLSLPSIVLSAVSLPSRPRATALRPAIPPRLRCGGQFLRLTLCLAADGGSVGGGFQSLEKGEAKVK